MKLFDAHLHIIDSRFPLVPNDGYLPQEFTCDDYLERMCKYEVVGGAVVSGSFQSFDQSYLLSALYRLGPSFVGVTQLPKDVTDHELVRLDKLGVRALRFNLKRGGSEDIRHLQSMAMRVHDVVGWHVELYVDSRELNDLYKALVSLPSVSIDHLGLSGDGLNMLLQLVEKGVHVKASGFSRCDMDIRYALRALFTANPDCLMFGTDLPSTRAPHPYADSDYNIVIEVLGEAGAERVFYKNAATFYRSHKNRY